MLGVMSMDNLYAFIGPHTSGKSTLIKTLKAQGIPNILSYTTRSKKDKETDGDEYKFITKDEFLQLDLIEKSTYKGELYGIPRQELLKKMVESRICVVSTDLNGYKQLRKFLNAKIHSIYLMIDYVTMIERMIASGESNEDVKKNLEIAEKNREFEGFKYTDYVVKTTASFDQTLNQILAIMGLLFHK
jgi:guanylate kinase